MSLTTVFTFTPDFAPFAEKYSIAVLFTAFYKKFKNILEKLYLYGAGCDIIRLYLFGGENLRNAGRECNSECNI